MRGSGENAVETSVTAAYRASGQANLGTSIVSRSRIDERDPAAERDRQQNLRDGDRELEGARDAVYRGEAGLFEERVPAREGGVGGDRHGRHILIWSGSSAEAITAKGG